MSGVNDCPGADVLRQFLLGQLAAPQVESLGAHLETCPGCALTLERISATDPLVESLRGPERAWPGEDGPEVRGLIARLEGLGTQSTSATAGRSGETPERPDGPATEEDYPFLKGPPEAGSLGRLGGYRVLGPLGAGGMGVVFQAEDPVLGRRVALKVIRPGRELSPSARQRFLVEARAAAAVRHDHIVTVYQAGEDEGTPFLVMELLEGETLETRLGRPGRLPLAEVVRIGREVAEGLLAAHEKGIVHRDIKPGNLWLEAGGRVKILDFGVARLAEDDPDGRGALLGTPEYMAPEQAIGAADARSDLFSLGCVLYRMATGRLPGGSPDGPQAPRDINPEVPAALSDLILRLLSKAPADRPATALVIKELRTAEARRPTAGKGWGPLVLAGGVAAGVVALGLGLVEFARQPSPGTEQAPVASSSKAEVKVGESKSLRRFVGHTGVVRCLAFSPDARWAVSGSGGSRNPRPGESADHTVRLWDVETGRESRLLFRDDRVIRQVAFTDSGRTVAATGLRWVQAWDRDTGDRSHRASLSPGWWSNGAGWSPGRDRFLVLCAQTSRARFQVWTPRGDAPEAEFEGPDEKLDAFAASPDLKWAVTVGMPPRHVVQLWDLGGKTRRGLFETPTSVLGLAFSPDGTRLLTGEGDGRIRLWNTGTGELVRDFHPEGAALASLAWMPDGKRFLSGGVGKDVRLRDADTGTELHRFRGHEATVFALAVSADGRLALSGDEAGAICLWEMPAFR